MSKFSNGGPHAGAISDYACSELTVIEIAQKHKVSVSVLSALVAAYGVPRRRRGRRRFANPSVRSQAILAYAAVHGFSKAAKHFNISRQVVSSTAKRWGLLPPQQTAEPRSTRTDLQSAPGEDKSTRDFVVSFRLRASEMSLLRASLPESVTQSTTSPHKLVRAAVLERVDNFGKLQNSAAVNRLSPQNRGGNDLNDSQPQSTCHEETIADIR